MSDIISRADAVEEIFKVGHEHIEDKVIPLGAVTDYSDAIKALPSVSANSDDLIIKNGKGIQDGLYNIKDGEIFKYKSKGGTVRAYKLVECVSADAVQIVRCKDCRFSSWNKYAECLDCYHFADGYVDDNDFCSRGERKDNE